MRTKSVTIYFSPAKPFSQLKMQKEKRADAGSPLGRKRHDDGGRSYDGQLRAKYEPRQLRAPARYHAASDFISRWRSLFIAFFEVPPGLGLAFIYLIMQCCENNATFTACRRILPEIFAAAWLDIHQLSISNTPRVSIRRHYARQLRALLSDDDFFY